MRLLALAILSSLFTLFLGFNLASADFSYRTPIDSVISKRAITVTWGPHNDRYLLYLGKGCGTLSEGQSVYINAHNDLQGGERDAVRVNSLHRCDIERADLIDHDVFVEFVYNSRDRAIVRDSSDERMTIYFDDRCHAIRKYGDEMVFALSGDRHLSNGDRLILPNDDGFCSITYVQKHVPREEVTVSGDQTNPSTVGNVKAVVENARVFLSWNPATDNVAVSHYLISVADGRINTRRQPSADGMPGTIRTTQTRYTLDGLTNDETHFIYLAAVDTSGNVSAHWTEVVAHPKSSSFRGGFTGVDSINARVQESNDRYTTLEWTQPTADFNYQLTLRADGKVIWKEDYSKRSSLRVINQPEFSGKIITLTLTRYTHRGFDTRESISFDF